MNPMLQAALGAIIRWALALLAGFFVKKGIWSDGDASTYVAAATVGLLTLGWGVWEKYKSRTKLLTALTLPEGSTENELKAHVQMGATPSVMTHPDSIPVAKEPL